jgi:hypothetical protein
VTWGQNRFELYSQGQKLEFQDYKKMMGGERETLNLHFGVQLGSNSIKQLTIGACLFKKIDDWSLC